MSIVGFKLEKGYKDLSSSQIWEGFLDTFF